MRGSGGEVDRIVEDYRAFATSIGITDFIALYPTLDEALENVAV